MIPLLERPKPALPSSYFWTWDHRTNWVLDDPGCLNWGWRNKYLKQPETFVEDYRRLTDLAAGLGVKGIIIWGFLRDSHGGIEYAKRVADYAASKDVAIMPGIGTTAYGGVYYEGDHPYNLHTFVEKNPDARLIREDGTPSIYLGKYYTICPSHPLLAEWLREGMQWLFREFAIGGANLENGDFLVCYCPRCKAARETRSNDEPDFFKSQGSSYEPALKAIEDQLEDKLVTYATYTGFLPGKCPGGPEKDKAHHRYMGCERPAMFDRLPMTAITQWTVSHMVLEQPLPLTAYLEDGAPQAAFENHRWPADVRPPSARGVGFNHSPGEEWGTRYSQAISTIKETCLRAHRSGLEGAAIHGEVSSRHPSTALNYLAFSHFIHWPEDTLCDFGRKTLGQVLGSEQEGEEYVRLLASWDAGELTEDQRKEIKKHWSDTFELMTAGQDVDRWRLWEWLRSVQYGDRLKVSSFF